MISGFVVPLAASFATQPTKNVQFAVSDFTWQTLNRNINVTTFVSPDGSKDELWHFLQSAEESIYVEIFGINNPYILELIHEIRVAKPSLDMKFLLGWNSLGYPNQNKYVANNLTLLGYPVKWTNSSDFTYAHQKFVIVDNETTIVHSGNWAKTSFPEDGFSANREWSIAMTDVEITNYYKSVFEYDWGRGTDYDAGTHGTGTPLTVSTDTSTYPRPFVEAGTFAGPMNVTPIFSPDTSLHGLLYCINSAQATLDIQIPYFTSIGDAGAVDQVVDAILAAKARGVTVRVISEEEKDWLEIEEMFQNHGIPIVWQDTRWFTANHNKGIIVDGRIVLISSINYSDGSITENREAGVIIENEQVAQWYSEIYDFDWGIADCDAMNEVNIYWSPNIPTSSSTINVTVYAHMLNSTNLDEVNLGVKIGAGTWSNYSIIGNIHKSEEGDLESYSRLLPAQADGTNITVQASIRIGATWYVGMEMVIRVRNSIGSLPTTTVTTTVDPLTQFLIEWGVYIAAAVAAVILGIVFTKRK
jgi:phosphatidylserine/phosphatidylglycerophosphate/cardiolipin synthase-like enzyme